MTSAAAGSSGYPGHDAGMPLSASGGELKTEHSFRMEIDFTSELHPQKECKAHDARMQNTLSLGKGLGELSSSVEKESKNDAEVVPSVICPLENLELPDENDLKALLGENACCATTKIVAVESANKVGYNSAR